MPITLPTRMPDGTNQDVEYLDVNEIAEIMPFHRNTIRAKLAGGEWSGTHFGNRWYMSRDDIADAVTASHHHATPQIGNDFGAAPLRLGVVVSDEHVDDIGGVR